MEPGITDISFNQMSAFCESTFALILGISDLSAGLSK